ncbi:MAG: hypothetical protein Q4G14_14675 [Paracoccus sp. (in: a-proteobacteria)]|uniref:hypothetical protein n=1 Tax=Paracoccus sp. TaxID=267 RepID=UPI0026E0C715|nr:hypothetical protein [Paracoccus sp. (in: a-proteobacteria)]MDO5614471.1 hypothetical protein [Paracoccus sp. (in: a-proteobacteria)]
MAHRRTNSRARHLALHLLALVALLAAAITQATLQGGLWPLDLRFSVLMTAGWLAVLALAWWPVAIALAALSGLLPRPGWRLALWPVALLTMAALHGLCGKELGFVPLNRLGAAGILRLYAIPVALPLVAGSALRAAFRAPLPERTSP